MYPNGFSPGFLDFDHVRINEEETDFFIGGYTEDILMLVLGDPLAPHEKVIIEMEYEVNLPNCLGRFGYGDNMVKMVNWYPIACVYDEYGWNLEPYHAIGDPFYSDVANYTVEIIAPEDYILATTGSITGKKGLGPKAKGLQTEEPQTEESSVLWEIRASAVRDFAWLAGNTFKTASRQVGTTLVTSYFYTPGAGERALDYAAESLKYFNEAFGKYPYANFVVVESDFVIGGMEYPNLIMIDHSLYQKNYRGYLEMVTVHETAHQWWYGLVGNNQVTDAWMDEGLTEYSTVLYYGHRYGQEKEEEVYENAIGLRKYQALSFYQGLKKIDETIHRPSYEFPDWAVYDLLVYGKGAMLFHSLREKMGEELFLQSLQDYYKNYRFQNVRKSDMIEIFNQVTKEDWRQHFDRWLYDSHTQKDGS